MVTSITSTGLGGATPTLAILMNCVRTSALTRSMVSFSISSTTQKLVCGQGRREGGREGGRGERGREREGGRKGNSKGKVKREAGKWKREVCREGEVGREEGVRRGKTGQHVAHTSHCLYASRD